MRPLCIYHSSCNDGFGSALILYKHFKGDIDFWRGKYNADKLPDCRDREVYIVDFSYGQNQMHILQQQSKKIIWLDHHVGAIKTLNGFQWRGQDVNGSQDNPMLSGVGLVWNYLYPLDPMPDLYRFIQDWDTWKFLLPHTRKIHFALHSYEQKFEIWERFLEPNELVKLITDGEVLLRKHDMNVASYVRQAFKMNIAGYEVPMVNAPADMASDVGNQLSVGQPFAGIWFETERGMSFSLRSQPDGMDVSEIAKLFGGGGHRNSAGFQVLVGRAPITPRAK